jgi:hypothetical protein
MLRKPTRPVVAARHPEEDIGRSTLQRAADAGMEGRDAARGPLTADLVINLQRTVGNQAAAQLVRNRPIQRTQTKTITEEPRPNPTLRLRLRSPGATSTGPAPEPDPDPGSGSQTTFADQPDDWGPGHRLGGESVLRFQGKEYYFEEMSPGRLERLLQAMVGTEDADRQIGAVAEAQRLLRRRRTAGPRPPTKEEQESEEARRRERRAERRLSGELHLLFQVAQLGRHSARFLRNLRDAAKQVAAARAAETCFEQLTPLGGLLWQLRGDFLASCRTLSCVSLLGVRHLLSMDKACDQLRVVLELPGIPNKKLHVASFRALLLRWEAWNAQWSSKHLTVLDLGHAFDDIVSDIQELSVTISADQAKASAKTKPTVNWDQYYNRADAHNQVLLNGDPEIFVTPQNSEAALRKARDVIQAVRGGSTLVQAATDHANSVTGSVLVGGAQRFHIRLTQGGTQIRLEALVTVRQVRDRQIQFIEFLQISYGHAGGRRSGTLSQWAHLL